MTPIPLAKVVAGDVAPEMLAGISVRIEAEEDLAVRPHQPPQLPANSATNGTEQPTIDQLAGVYVQVEAIEDLTVRPRTDPANSRHLD